MRAEHPAASVLAVLATSRTSLRDQLPKKIIPVDLQGRQRIERKLARAHPEHGDDVADEHNPS